ncbi:MAG: DUF1249 domain-containing protein [Gammaproteobacteria bacterium]|nr:DUF1249 domain-containing protein [Gammaproteobacteria bacterium]
MVKLKDSLGVSLHKPSDVNSVLDLFAHVARCEANYSRLRKLMQTNKTREFQSRLVEFSNGAGALVFDHSKISLYTSTVTIRQTSTEELTNLNLKLHVYHDTRAAEVVSYQHHTNFRVLETKPNPPRTQRFEKVEMNRFLGELLDHCLLHGKPLNAETEQGSSIST